MSTSMSSIVEGEVGQTSVVPSSSRTQRRKLSSLRQSRFSVDYFGFPRNFDNESGEDSETGGGSTGTTATNNNYKSMEGVRGNRSLQYLATLAANMSAFAMGTALSYPAVALPSLRKDVLFGTIMTELDESWIGALFALGAVVSGPVAGFSIERMGRRLSMLVLSVPFFLSWVLINSAYNIPMILIGRFLTGFFSGVYLVAAPIFTAEISDASIRGAVGATFDMSSSVGILFIYVVGSYCTWRTQALICAAVPLIIFILMLFVPESPAYLLEKGRTEAARNALKKYKGAKSPEAVLAALDDLQQEIVDSKATENTGFRDLLSRPILIPVSVAFMVFVFQVICGLDPILIYTVDIFKAASTTDNAGHIDEYTSTVVFGVIELFAGIAAAFFVDRTGRRFLLLLSEAVMVLSLAALGLFFFLRGGITPTPPEPLPTPPPGVVINASYIAWIPLTSLSFFIFFYSIGLGPVGYLLMGEILPLRVKGLAGSILTSAKWLLSFLVTKFFDDFIHLLGEAGCFWLFAGFCLIGFICIYIFVPETNGRSLEEIQRMFRKRFSLKIGEGEPLLPAQGESTSLNLNTASGDDQPLNSSSSKQIIPNYNSTTSTHSQA